MSAYPRTVQEIHENVSRRKDALRKALTDGELLFLDLYRPNSRRTWSRGTIYLCVTSALSTVPYTRRCGEIFHGMPSREGQPLLVRYANSLIHCSARTDISTFTLGDTLQAILMVLGLLISLPKRYLPSCPNPAWASTLPETAWQERSGWP